MKTFCLLIAAIIIGSTIAAHADEPIVLNAGEILLSIDGVPVAQTCVNGRCPITPIRTATKAIVANAKAVGVGTAAYAQCLREARMMASANRAAHYLGVPAGCSFSGVGYSMSVDVPSHCTSGGRLVARAYAVGSNGRVYWSACYSR